MIKACQHCGSEEGYFKKATVSGKTFIYYKFNGEQGDNWELHDDLIYKEQKTMYCAECEARLGIENA